MLSAALACVCCVKRRPDVSCVMVMCVCGCVGACVWLCMCMYAAVLVYVCVRAHTTMFHPSVWCNLLLRFYIPCTCTDKYRHICLVTRTPPLHSISCVVVCVFECLCVCVCRCTYQVQLVWHMCISTTCTPPLQPHTHTHSNTYTTTHRHRCVRSGGVLVVEIRLRQTC